MGFFFPYKSLYFECYATMPMLADAHISSLGYLWVKALISKVYANDATFYDPQTWRISTFALAERNLERATAKGLGVTPTKHRGRSCRRHKIFDHRNKSSVVDIFAAFCVRRKHLLGTVMDERLDQNEDNRYRPTSAVQVCVVQD